MELALIPVAAILLLLSGASAPAQAQPGRLSAIALMRELLGATAPVSATRPERRRFRAGFRAGSRTKFSAGLRAASPPRGAHRLTPLISREVLTSRLQKDLAGPPSHLGWARAAERKRFRTRFGFAEGAYLAIGPPAVGSLVDLG